jgi:hypothetical protein
MTKPVLTHCIYRPKKGKEEALFGLVKKHWPTLKKAGLTTSTPAQVYRAQDKHGGRTFFVEIFAWKDDQAAGTAHQLPEVMAVWEPMGELLDPGPSPELAVLEEVRGEA